MKDALKHLEEAAPLRSGGPPVFTGIFAYAGATVATLMTGWRAFHDMSDDDAELEPDDMHLIFDIGTAVTAICVLRQSMLLSAYVPAKMDKGDGFTPAIIQVESFAKRKSEAAVFFDVLSRYLRHPFTGSLLGDGVRASVYADLIVTYQERAYDDRSWGPYMLGDETPVEDFLASHQAYDRWLNGGAWELKAP